MITADYLIVGSGIAGLSVALNISTRYPSASVLVVTKSETPESNTRYAQGGIAVVMDHSADSFDAHIEDTLRAGDGLCNLPVVEHVVRDGPVRLRELMNRGVRFDEELPGTLHLGREGGHSRHRIIHHADATGLEIERALINRVMNSSSIRVLSHHFTVDLIVKGDGNLCTCTGAWVLDVHARRMLRVHAKATVLATGGAGQIYLHTTNPVVATGDGMAMAFRAGAVMSDMEFVQFHPTALFQPEKSPAFLISEAVRGAGAILKTPDGMEFMSAYDSRGGLASRDIVTRAIGSEMKRGNWSHVYLDARYIPVAIFRRHFPTIMKRCKAEGIRVDKDMIPVAPAAHYFCGGIQTDMNGSTSIQHLYACGECASTGLHGANRLASNSLLEAIVLAHRCAEAITDHRRSLFLSEECAADPGINVQPEISSEVVHRYRTKLQHIMTDLVGIVRSDEGLKSAMRQLHLVFDETKSWCSGNSISEDVLTFRNMLDVAHLVVKHALLRRENRGVHFNSDLTFSDS